MWDFGGYFDSKYFQIGFFRYPHGVYILPQITFGVFKDSFEYSIPLNIRWIIFEFFIKIKWNNLKSQKEVFEQLFDKATSRMANQIQEVEDKKVFEELRQLAEKQVENRGYPIKPQ